MGESSREEAFAYLEWVNGFNDGFYGIVQSPLGDEGFLSIIGGGTTWTPIVEGQDEIEVMIAAKALHDACSSSESVDPDYIKFLGEQREQLTRPITS